MTVITGSFNFSKSAEEKNAENLLILKECPQLINSYNRNFDAHAAHSQAYREPYRREVEATQKDGVK